MTITGENLPQGSLVVEFYPQHIALLNVLSATAQRIEAQIKVPSLAPAGQYNIVVYNQLGEEVFAEALLTVTSKILTPVFRDYDPKSIAKASGGFALMLSGDVVTREAVDHLTMQWTINDVALPSLQTTFAYGGHGTIVCAVSGDLPGGVVTGRVLLDEKPIYMVEVTIQSELPVIVGNDPVRLDAAAVPYVVRILGSGFTPDALQLIAIELSSAETTARPRTVVLVDAATLSAEFSGPLPAGTYAIRVLSGAELLYAGQLDLTSSASQLEPASVEQPVADSGDTTAADSQVASAQPADTPPPSEQAVQAQDEAAAESLNAQVTAVEPTVIDAGTEPCRLMFAGSDLTPALLERLRIELSFADQQCELLFIGAGATGFTCIFDAPAAGFIAGASGSLTIADPEQQLAPFTQTMSVAAAAEEPAAEAPGLESEDPPDEIVQENPISADEQPVIDTAATPDSAAVGEIAHVPWTAIQSGIQEGITGPALIVHFVPPAAGWDPSQITASFNLLPAEQASTPEHPLTLSGELRIGRDAGGLPVGICPGRFANGELLVQVVDGEHPAQLTALNLVVSGTIEAPVEPGASNIAPGGSAAVNCTRDTCEIGSGGFELLLRTEARQLEAQAWSDLAISADALVLDRNLSSFVISVELQEDELGTNLIVRLERDAIKLPDLPYTLLMDELCSKPAVKLSLSWNSVAASAECTVRFLPQS